MKIVFCKLFSIALGLMAISTAQAEERIWTGINGKTFRGTFLSLEENNTKALFITSANQQVRVAIANLIQADRDRLVGRPAAPAPAPAPGALPTPAPAAPSIVDTGDGFKPLPNANRALIPGVKPKDLSASNDEALVDAIWVSFLWWEKINVLEVPGRGDYAKRAEQLHQDLSREISKGGRSSATLEEAKEGVEAYFKDELSDTATCRVKIVKDSNTVPAIAATLVEARAVVIKMTMTYDNGRDFSISTVLESLTPEGKFAFHVFGTRLHGEVKTDAKGKQEWIVANRDAMPEYYREQEPRFYLNQNEWNGLLLIDPFVYKTKGKPSPLPPDQAIKPAPVAPPAAPVVISGQIHPKALEVPRRTPNLRLSRAWNLIDGTRIDGAFYKMDGDSYILRTPQTREAKVKLEQLPPDQRAALIFQRGCTETAEAPRLDLTYHFTTPTRKNIEIKISSEGALGRLSVPSTNNHWIFNLADQTAADYLNTLPESRKPFKCSKYLPERMLHSALPLYVSDKTIDKFPKNLDYFAQSAFSNSNESVVSGLNALSLIFPYQPDNAVSVYDLEMDFVQVNPPAALTALLNLLSPRGANRTDGYLPNGTELDCHSGFDQIGPYLSVTRVLPLRMKWRNKINAQYVDLNDRNLTAGTFSLELVRATSPDSFPANHFHIPSEASALVPGTARQY